MKTTITIILLFLSQSFYCQILGKVIDEKGNSLSNVSVTIQDSITTTDNTGLFRISANLTSKLIDLSFQHPRRGAKIFIKKFPTKRVRKMEIEMPRLLEYYGEVIDETQFVFIPCLCYTNQSYPYYKNKLDKDFITITVNDVKHKITNYEFDEPKNMFIINWNKI